MLSTIITFSPAGLFEAGVLPASVRVSVCSAVQFLYISIRHLYSR